MDFLLKNLLEQHYVIATEKYFFMREKGNDKVQQLIVRNRATAMKE